MAKKILFIDPDAALEELLRIVLGQHYDLVYAPNLTEGCRMLNNNDFDLIITEAFDQRDRFIFDPTFLSDLKRRSPGTPILLISTYAEGHRNQAEEYGVDALLPKPFDIDDLAEAVGKLVGVA